MIFGVDIFPSHAILPVETRMIPTTPSSNSGMTQASEKKMWQTPKCSAKAWRTPQVTALPFSETFGVSNSLHPEATLGSAS
jgi:hypothetical protein